MTSRNYGHPPVQEAVFDIRFNFSKTPTVEDLERFWKTIETEFPKKDSVFNFQTMVEFNPTTESPSVNNQREQVGIRLSSLDGSRILQIKVDGIAFSRVNGYDGCTTFLEEATDLMKKYVVDLKPSYAERIALRYINAIHIPETIFELSDYFLTAPNIGSDIKQNIVAFFFRAMLKDKESATLAIINQTTGQPQITGETVVIFDIDTFQQAVRIDPLSVDFAKTLDEIKLFRTSIFEGSLTDKARKLFD